MYTTARQHTARPVQVLYPPIQEWNSLSLQLTQNSFGCKWQKLQFTLTQAKIKRKMTNEEEARGGGEERKVGRKGKGGGSCNWKAHRWGQIWDVGDIIEGSVSFSLPPPSSDLVLDPLSAKLIPLCSKFNFQELYPTFQQHQEDFFKRYFSSNT